MRRGHARARAAATAAALGLLLGTAACGADESSDSTDTSAGSGTGSTTGDGPGYATGDEVPTEDFAEILRGSIEQATTAQLTMDVEGGGQSLAAEGEVDYTTDTPEMRMTLDSPALAAEPIDLVLADRVMYIDLGALSGGKFLSFDLADPSALPPGMAGLADQLDPMGAFEEFVPALERVVYRGAEEVEGERLDRYAVTVDSAEIEGLQGLPGDAPLPDTITYDLSFDGDGLMRAMRTELDLAQSIAVEARLSDWGEPVEIAAPPRSDVMELPDMGGATG